MAHQRAREPDGQGISIASRWPLGDVHEVDLQVTPRTKDFACATLIAQVRAPDPVGPLLFANHLPNWQLDLEHRIFDQPVDGVWASDHFGLVADLALPMPSRRGG